MSNRANERGLVLHNSFLTSVKEEGKQKTRCLCSVTPNTQQKKKQKRPTRVLRHKGILSTFCIALLQHCQVMFFWTVGKYDVTKMTSYA